jgi:predicted nucleic acid-binding protein
VKALLDACVLYPTVLREILTGVAGQGVYVPLWSARILEEWARAARKLGPVAEVQARGEVAALRAAFPASEVAVPEGLVRRLHLPDPDDVHVLAAAIAGRADVIVTFNAADFPRATLAEDGIARQAPDEFLIGLWRADPVPVATAVAAVHAEAERLSGQPWPLRALLKKAGLPRLGKALDRPPDPPLSAG